MDDVEIVPWGKSWDRGSFDCGVEDLNRWLTQYSGQAQRSDSARTHLVVSGRTVIGYFSLVAGRLETEDIEVAGLSSRYPMPALLLARLAIDRRWHGCGLGSTVLAHVVLMADRILDDVAFQVLVVDAIDRNAAAFYARFGFSRFRDDPQRLYLTARQIRASVHASA